MWSARDREKIVCVSVCGSESESERRVKGDLLSLSFHLSISLGVVVLFLRDKCAEVCARENEHA
jgi:hypothetical protein